MNMLSLCRHYIVVITTSMHLLSLLHTPMCCRCCRHYVDIIVSDMKLLLVCLVLLGCTVSHVSTGEQIHLMKRFHKAQEMKWRLFHWWPRRCKYLKCTRYVHNYLPVFSLKLLRISPHQCVLSCVSLDTSKCSCQTFRRSGAGAVKYSN